MQLQVVKDYYGKLLKSSKDLKTSACRDGASVPSHVQPLLDNVHPEVVSKYYGCGLVAPAELRGRRVLDLGAGSGRDAYLLAQLVGPFGEGRVVSHLRVEPTSREIEQSRVTNATRLAKLHRSGRGLSVMSHPVRQLACGCQERQGVEVKLPGLGPQPLGQVAFNRDVSQHLPSPRPWVAGAVPQRLTEPFG